MTYAKYRFLERSQGRGSGAAPDLNRGQRGTSSTLPSMPLLRALWCAKYSTIAAAWERAWEYVLPFFVFPPEVRRVIYITDAIENMNR